MGKIQEMVDEALRIQRMTKAAKKILERIEPVDTTNTILFDGPPTDPNYFIREQLFISKIMEETKTDDNM